MGLTTLDERRHRADMALMHSVIHGHTEIEVEDWFSMVATGPKATRAATGSTECDPQTWSPRPEFRKNFFTVRSTSSWNNVPREIKRTPSAEGFKSGFAKYREQNNN